MARDGRFLQWVKQVSREKLELARTAVQVWEGYAAIGVLLTILAITAITFPLIMPVLQAGGLEAVGAENENGPPVFDQTTVFYSDFGQKSSGKIKFFWTCRPRSDSISFGDGYRCGMNFNWPENESGKVRYLRYLGQISDTEPELEARWKLINGNRSKIQKTNQYDFDTHSIERNNVTGSYMIEYGKFWSLTAPRPAGKYVLQITAFPGELNQSVRVEGRSQSKVVQVEKPNGKSSYELQKINTAVGLFVLFTAWFSGIQTLATLFDRITSKSNQ